MTDAPTNTESRSFPKRFDFKARETKIYDAWLQANAFQTAYGPDGSLQREAKKDAPPFVIVIPPPNITGRLHMGHALNNTVQDVLIRYKRMDGFDALWIPGTDHAGIATQQVVKRQLDAQGIDYRELGREEVIKRIWEWKETYGDAILKQLQRMGCSCDWNRLRFTMDEGLNHAVRAAFKTLYDQGLIYRGKRIVNWCPVDRTALSDDEVEKKDEKGKMFHIRYPFQDNPREHLIVATTRPETLFGDVAVAVHPDDENQKPNVGRKIVLPLQGRIIPVIADEHADPEKGSGCVKITPAHDPNDFDVGLRHNLEQINVMNEDASLNEIVPEPYRGMPRYKARAKIIKDLEDQGLLEKIEDHVLAIGKGYRSKENIEFRLSDQWFVKMDRMAEMALTSSGYQKTAEGWKKASAGSLHIHPERFEKTYFHWLANIRDWCISRQIWWGHRIPAWFHRETGEVLVEESTPDAVQKAPEDWVQETDVLDTWFSSWLWPMSTLGWPEKTPDFDRYYPTSVLSTAKDILFFWVARMNFAGLRFEERLPYKNVFLHSTIADETGTTMSKSKGNGIDPMSIIEGADAEALKQPVLDARPPNMKALLNRVEKNYPQGFEAVGADAMRWTLVYSITEGEHVRLSLKRFTEGRNFITKLWNGAGRVITALAQEADHTTPPTPPTEEDRWLTTRLDSTIADVRSGLDSFDFAKVAQALYRFTWDDFCAWALELSKTRLNHKAADVRRGALRGMSNTLANLLRLLHPIVPFVTEELWSKLVPEVTRLGLWEEGQRPSSNLLVLDTFPKPKTAPNPEIEARFAVLQRFVVAVRQLRAASNIKDAERIVVEVKAISPDAEPMLTSAKEAVCFLAKLDSFHFVDARTKGHAAQYDDAFEIYLDLAKYIDLKEEVSRLEKEIAKSEKDLQAVSGKLNNKNFVNKAPADKVEEAKQRSAELSAKIEKLRATHQELSQL